MRINVGFLLNQPKGTYRDFPFDLPGIELSKDVTTGQLIGNARISRTSEGLLVQGEYNTTISTTCVRCLEKTEPKLHTEFTELYVFPQLHGNEFDTEEEPELILPNDGYIDMEPLVSEYLLLEIPMKPLCKPDCKGLCSFCGTNLNQATCEHQKQSANPATLYPLTPGS
jgi:uncharacterized protein